MRQWITGVKDGKACMVEVKEFEPGGPEVIMHDFVKLAIDGRFRRPKGKAPLLDLGVGPGEMRWITTYGPPNNQGHAQFHHTNTIDCHTILAGDTTLILDDGEHVLRAGDVAIVMGVDHAWAGSKDGSQSSIVIIGIHPPEDESA